MTYTIEPYEWNYVDEDTYNYVDEDLRMIVTLEKHYPYDSYWNEEQGDSYCLMAQSATIIDEGNYYYYDALSDCYYCGPSMNHAPADDFFCSGEELRDVILPDWLIEEMKALVAIDDTADGYFWEWSQSLGNNAEFTDYDEAEASLNNWMNREYPDRTDDIRADFILYVAEQNGGIYRSPRYKTYTVCGY